MTDLSKTLRELLAEFETGSTPAKCFELAKFVYDAQDTILTALELQERVNAPETFQIGDMVEVIPETAGMDWRGEPPHYITGIDWHSEYGVTYTTSETWPPRVEGLRKGGVGLTDEWLPDQLRATLKGDQ